jgi:hypothetical protein
MNDEMGSVCIVARMVQRRNADGVLVRKPEEKRQL